MARRCSARRPPGRSSLAGCCTRQRSPTSWCRSSDWACRTTGSSNTSIQDHHPATDAHGDHRMPAGGPANAKHDLPRWVPCHGSREDRLHGRVALAQPAGRTLLRIIPDCVALASGADQVVLDSLFS
jgi:hypothetical protein